jgi:uncharacterized membrane protein
MSTARWTDEKVDHFIGTILQAGVLASGILVLAGGILYAIHNGPAAVNYHVFQTERAAIKSVRPILTGAIHLDGRAIIQLGILLLIATPVARVMFSVAAFGLQRDRLYVPITLIVLAILIYGLFGGRH